MAWTLCTSGAAVLKAGANANSTISSSGAALLIWSNEAEGIICAETTRDWVTNYASVGANFKQALADAATAKIAINIINYDMSGYTSRSEAQTMLDVNKDIYNTAMKILKDKNTQTKMGLTG